MTAQQVAERLQEHRSEWEAYGVGALSNSGLPRFWAGASISSRGLH